MFMVVCYSGLDLNANQILGCREIVDLAIIK